MHWKTQGLEKKHRTFSKGRAVRMPNYDYAQNVPVHLTICATINILAIGGLPKTIGDSVEFCCRKLRYELFCYCLMPDHLHVLLSPAESRVPIGKWLEPFKSFTTHEHMRFGGKPPLWQLSANDHVCRAHETIVNVVMYIANNPVRARLVEKWDDWVWTKVFVEV